MNNVKLSLMKIAATVYISMAVVSLAISLFFYSHAHNFTRTALRARGTIIRMVEKPGRDSKTVYYPVFSFRDLQSRRYIVNSTSGQNTPAYKAGDVVQVLYQEYSPANAEIENHHAIWGRAVIFGWAGAGSLLVGLGLLTAIKFRNN